jgi:hypothetical protein
LLFNP